MVNLSEQEIEYQLNQELEKLKKAVVYIETAKENSVNAQKTLADFQVIYNEVKHYKDDFVKLSDKSSQEIADSLTKMKVVYDNNKEVSKQINYKFTEFGKTIEHFYSSFNNFEKSIEYFNKQQKSDANELSKEFENIRKHIERERSKYEQKVNNLETQIKDIKNNHSLEFDKLKNENTNKINTFNKISYYSIIIATSAITIAIIGLLLGIAK